MPSELVLLPSAFAASYAFVNNQRFQQWAAARPDYPAHGLNRLYQWLTEGVPGGQTGAQVRSHIDTQVKSRAREFLRHYFHTHLNYAISDTVIANTMIRVRFTSPALEAIRNLSVLQAAGIAQNRRAQIEEQARNWVDRIRNELVGWWMDHVHTAGLQAPARRDDPQVSGAAGVACAVWVHRTTAAGWQRLGNMYTAALHSTGPYHAEMQWIANHGDALAPLLATTDQVEFHISEQPCGAYCAQRIIEYWAGLGTAVPGYVVTYTDTDGRANIYRLMDDAIARLT
jgi:hypothetical protein